MDRHLVADPNWIDRGTYKVGAMPGGDGIILGVRGNRIMVGKVRYKVVGRVKEFSLLPDSNKWLSPIY